MSNIPADLRFAESHEWARLEADGTVTVGISDHAQEALGDVVFVELTEVGKVFAAEDQAGVVESVKAASTSIPRLPVKWLQSTKSWAVRPSCSTPTRTALGSSSSSQATWLTWTSCSMPAPTKPLSASKRSAPPQSPDLSGLFRSLIFADTATVPAMLV